MFPRVSLSHQVDRQGPMMIVVSKPQRRTFHRVQFPLAEQPRWITGSASFSVLDLSETSCRLCRVGQNAVDAEHILRGPLKFPDGDQVWVEGEVLRLEAQEIIVHFTKGLSFKKIIGLQRWLVQKYPARRDGESAIDPQIDIRAKSVLTKSAGTR